MNKVYNSLLMECTTDTFWKCSERAQKCSKISKIPKNLCETVPFSLSLQPCSPVFLTSATTDSKKNVSFEYSEIVGSLPEKSL